MDRIKLKEIQDKHVFGYLRKNPMARFEDIPTSVFIDAMEEAINYMRCSTQLFGTSKIEIDCVTINQEYKIIFENDETYVFINDFGQADEMYKKQLKT